MSITRELEKTLITEISNEIDLDKKKKAIKKISVILMLVIVFLGVCGYVFWLNNTYKPDEYANHAFLNSQGIKVVHKDDNSLEFYSDNKNSGVGIIIVPAQKVEPKSYTRISKLLTENGHSVFVPKLILNNPVFSGSRIESIIDMNSNIDKWYVVSHSDSGNTVLKVATNKKSVEGVVFLGSYVQSDDLKLINKPALLIWGTKDGVLDFSKFNENKKNLSSNTMYYEIVGGNNTNFADMEIMKKDNKSTITAEEQQNQTSDKILKFINEMLPN